MTKEELRLSQLEFSVKWLRELASIALKHAHGSPGLSDDCLELTKRMTADAPSDWPKNEPEVGQVLVDRLMSGKYPSS